MERDAILRSLREQKSALERQFCVKTLSLFGSAARDESTAISDVDLLVEFNRPVGYFGLFALQDHLEIILGCAVDPGTPESLKPRLRDRVMKDLIRVA